MKNNYKSSKLLVLLVVFFALNACKKMEPLPIQADDKITEYKVTNTNQGAIQGAIDESSKTITVYIPFYFGLQVIVPAIQVSPGARLDKPATPVPILSDTTTYKVIGADNSNSVYKLKIVIQQQTPLMITGVSADSPNDGDAFTVAGGIWVEGNFNTLNYNLVNVFMVTNSGQELPLAIDPTNATAYSNGDSTGYTMGPYTIPNTLDSGSTYHLRVKLNGLTANWPTAIQLIYPKTVLAYGDFTLKQGDSFTVSATLFSMIPPIQSVSYTYNGNTYALQLVSQDTKSAVIQVPNNFPVGSYPYGIGLLNFNFKNGTKSSTTIGLHVSTK